MSYDLSLYPAEDKAAPSIPALDTYFAARPGYSVETGVARYGNEHTGTYFRFRYDDTQRGYGDVGPIGLTASIQGPATRALEIADELEALASAFGLIVDDPTMEGMGKGVFDRPAFIRGAHFAARFGYGVSIAMSQMTPETVARYDDAKLEAYWRWNRARDRLQAQVGDEVFVPHVTFVRDGKRVLSSVAWVGDGAILLPEVDVITTIGTTDGAKLVFVPYAAIATELATLPVRSEGGPHRLVKPSAAMTATLRSAKPAAKEPTQLAFDDVLGHEFWAATMDQYMKWSGGKKLVFVDDSKPKKKRKATATKKKAVKAKPKAKGKPKTAKPKAKTAKRR